MNSKIESKTGFYKQRTFPNIMREVNDNDCQWTKMVVLKMEKTPL